MEVLKAEYLEKLRQIKKIELNDYEQTAFILSDGRLFVCYNKYCEVYNLKDNYHRDLVISEIPKVFHGMGIVKLHSGKLFSYKNENIMIWSITNNTVNWEIILEKFTNDHIVKAKPFTNNRIGIINCYQFIYLYNTNSPYNLLKEIRINYNDFLHDLDQLKNQEKFICIGHYNRAFLINIITEQVELTIVCTTFNSFEANNTLYIKSKYLIMLLDTQTLKVKLSQRRDERTMGKTFFCYSEFREDSILFETGKNSLGLYNKKDDTFEFKSLRNIVDILKIDDNHFVFFLNEPSILFYEL